MTVRPATVRPATVRPTTLAGRHLGAGQSLLITVTAPHRRAERIALGIRTGQKPTARLLGR